LVKVTRYQQRFKEGWRRKFIIVKFF
jgi:hypothetical protein